MYIVEHISSGKFFKKGKGMEKLPDGRISFYNGKLVDRQDATVFRNISGIKNCLGKWTKLDQPIKKGKYSKQYGKMVLDETKWKIHPIVL